MKTLLVTFFMNIIAKSFFGYDNFDFLNIGPFDVKIKQSDIDEDLLMNQ